MLFDGDLSYAINDRTSAHLDTARSFAETGTKGVAGAVLTSLSLGVRRVVRRDLTLDLDTGITHADFEGLNRASDLFSAQLGLTYAFNDSLSFLASYRYSQRISDSSEDEFYRDVFQIGIKLRF